MQAKNALVCSPAGADDAVFHTSCTLTARSDDPNYNTSERTTHEFGVSSTFSVNLTFKSLAFLLKGLALPSSA